MILQETRNFDCPETGEPCLDGRCTKELCCEGERLQAAMTREVAAKKERIVNAEVWEIIGPMLREPNSRS